MFLFAGLCLATITTFGCSNDGPIAPPLNAGQIFISDDGDGELISNEPVVIMWDFIPRINEYRIDYSIDGGKSWLLIGKSKLTKLNWKIPAGMNTFTLQVRADGYSIQFPTPQSRATSMPLKVLSHGNLDHLAIIAPDTIPVGQDFEFVIAAYDYLNNVVTDYQPEMIFIYNMGSTKIRLKEIWLETGTVMSYVSPLLEFKDGICYSWTPAYIQGYSGTILFNIKVRDPQLGISIERMDVLTVP